VFLEDKRNAIFQRNVVIPAVKFDELNGARKRITNERSSNGSLERGVFGGKTIEK